MMEGQELSTSSLGGMDMSTLLMGMAFQQSPILKPLAPIMMQLSVQAKKDKQAQQIVSGLGQVHAFTQAGDFAGANKAMEGLSKFVTKDTLSVYAKVQKDLQEQMQQQVLGQTMQEVAKINQLPMEQRQDAFTKLIPQAIKSGANAAMLDAVLPNQKVEINQQAGVATGVDPKTLTVTNQPFRPVAGAETLQKFQQGLSQLGANPQEVLAALNSGNPELVAKATQLMTLAESTQAKMDTQRDVARQQQVTNIQVAGQMKAASHSAAVHGAEQRKTFMFQQLNELPTEDLKFAARASNIPVKPAGQYSDEEAQKVIFTDTMRKTLVAEAGKAATPPPVEIMKGLHSRTTMMQAAQNIKEIVQRRPDLVGPVSGNFKTIEEALTGSPNDPDASRLITAINVLRDTNIRAEAGLSQTGSEAERATGFLKARQPTMQQNPNVLLNRLDALMKDAMGAIDLDLAVYGGTTLAKAKDLINQRVNSPILGGTKAEGKAGGQTIYQGQGVTIKKRGQ